MMITTVNNTVVKKISQLLKRACSKIPGLYTLLDMQARTLYGRSFAELFLQKPVTAYNMLVGFTSSKEGADMIMRMMLKSFVSDNDVEALLKLLHEGKENEFAERIIRLISEDRGLELRFEEVHST